MIGHRQTKQSSVHTAAVAAILVIAGPWAVFAQRQPLGQAPHGRQLREGQPGAPGRMPGAFPGGPQIPRLEAIGQVDAVAAPGLIRMVASDGQVWTLALAANARLRLKGTMKAELIHPGQFIHFEATVEHKTGEVEEKLKQVTVFTPTPDNPDTQLGAFPVQPGAGDTPGNPFGQPLGGAASPFEQPLGGAQAGESAAGAGDLSHRSRTARSRGKAAPPPPAKAKYDIRGRITEIDRNGTLTVLVPNVFFRPPVKVALAEDVQVAVDLAGPTVLGLMAKGDRIEAKGVQVGPTAAEVAEVSIEKLEPIAPDHPPRAAASRSSRRTQQRDADAHEEEGRPMQGKAEWHPGESPETPKQDAPEENPRPDPPGDSP